MRKSGKGIEQIHCHQTNTCYYDDRPQDTENGSVTDTTYNDGRIERERRKTNSHFW